MRFSTLMMAAALLCPGLVAHAQGSRENAPYKVDFTIRDTGDAGGKTGRKYSMVVSSGHKTTFGSAQECVEPRANRQLPRDLLAAER